MKGDFFATLYDKTSAERNLAQYRLWLVERLSHDLKTENPKIAKRLQDILIAMPMKIEDAIGACE